MFKNNFQHKDIFCTFLFFIFSIWVKSFIFCVFCDLLIFKMAKFVLRYAIAIKSDRIWWISTLGLLLLPSVYGWDSRRRPRRKSKVGLLLDSQSIRGGRRPRPPPLPPPIPFSEETQSFYEIWEFLASMLYLRCAMSPSCSRCSVLDLPTSSS